MSEQDRRDRVREKVSELLLEGNHEHGNWFEGLCRSSCGYRSKKRCEYFTRCGYRVFIDQILSLEDGKMIAVLAEDPSLPIIPSCWQKVDREFEAFCAGQNSLLRNGWRKVL